MTYTLEEVYDALEQEQLCNIGILIGTLLTGGMLSLGVSCIFRLYRTQKKEALRQHRLLQVYVITLLLLVIGTLIVTILQYNVFTIFYIHSTPSQGNKAGIPLVFLGNLAPVLVAGLTDGLLVWRCYRMQKLLLPYESSPPRWQNILWIFPAFLWVLINVAGWTGALMTLPILISRSSDLLAPSDALEETALLSNAMLNAYATMFIAVRLLKHKKSLMVSIAREQVKSSRHLEHIVRIFLESAAINVPIAIVTAVGVSSNSVLGSIMTTIMFTCQTLSSIIIIHQVIEGRESSSRNEELSTLKFRVTEGEQPSISDQSKATLTMIDAGAQNV